jgi:hypothetical protein
MPFFTVVQQLIACHNDWAMIIRRNEAQRMKTEPRRYRPFDLEHSGFYRLPKFLFTMDSFRKLPIDAKVAYAMLYDRFEESIANGNVDNDGFVYMNVTPLELSDMLNISVRDATWITKFLLDHNLLQFRDESSFYLLTPAT